MSSTTVSSFRDLDVWRLAYQNHISIAMGSQGELETEIEIARRNLLISNQTCERVQAVIDRVGAMLYRLHESLDKPDQNS